MFIGRVKELQYLNDFYEKKGNQILVVYGQKGIGKTTLLEVFSKEKEAFYYEAVSCSLRQQCEFFAQSLTDMGLTLSENDCFETILQKINERPSDKKKILIIDEFHNLCKTETDFFESLKIFLATRAGKTDLLIILSSSMTAWVENTMQDKLGEYYSLINDVYRIKDMKFYDFKEYFPELSCYDSIMSYGILGGNPGLWCHFKDNLTVYENIENSILDNKGMLHKYGEQWVAEELREISVYNTILTALSIGKNKLNDLYKYTGFSRAKLSVYLKQLIQLDLVEKVESLDTEGREYTKKGVYRIVQPYLRFYYCFLFPNQAKIRRMGKREFYEAFVEPFLPAFLEETFKQVCREFVERENEKGRLPGRFVRLGNWNGKMGNIDFIYQEDEADEILAGICNWGKEFLTYKDYKLFLECQNKSKIKADYAILFSATDFEQLLKEEARNNPRLALIHIKAFE